MTLTVASEDIAGSPEFRHLTSIDGIAIDLRYATPNNFVGRDLYSPFDSRRCQWFCRRRSACHLLRLPLHVAEAGPVPSIRCHACTRKPIRRGNLAD